MSSSVRVHVLGFAFAAGAALLTGCSGNGNNPNSAGLPCGAPTGQFALVYPASGSTGIPDNLPGIVFGSTNGLGASYQAVLLPAGASQPIDFEFIAPAPSPLPSPNALPTFKNPVYQESALPPGTLLPALTQIGVYLNDGNSNCTPILAGSFTTQ